ncbi:mechanosensitive ion channel family protein [Draconibacterium sp. IB214405]|uniref:mechanosensitive ion channel family protein n=1 Tax=Draconibacterium sp. IB214405 TaxID=3097352 RepID=UPI002A10324A|nr:mechanosensitive ion channel family protein [Draconibacterium sp. IB214405]MDX8341514.1 mechanosensitive ion channel family protein [Draconibacterium sp. IB214405]
MEIDFLYWGSVFGIVIISYFLSLIVRRILSRIIRKKSDNLKEDPTKFVFLKNSVSFIIFIIALIIIFLITPALNDIGKGLFAGAGIMAATIGFASQKAFSNILSGIFILIFKPFSVQDTIEIKTDNLKGVVEEITLRHTVIRDYENRRIVIPNSLISETTLLNSSMTDEKIKKHVEFGISYDSDIDLAKKIIKEEILKHPNFIDNRSDEEREQDFPLVSMRLVSLGDFSVNIRAYVWARSNDEAFVLQCDVFESVKKRFDKEGVEIPFPYRTLVFKNKPDKID